MSKVRAFVDGPEVYLAAEDRDQIKAQQLEITAGSDIELVFPPTTEGIITRSFKDQQSFSVSDFCTAYVREYDERIRSCAIFIANMTPNILGPSADPGLARNMGYARRSGLTLFGFSSDDTSFLERVRRHAKGQVDVYRGRLWVGGNPMIFSEKDKAADTPSDYFKSMALEAFGLNDNLMLEGAIYHSGGDFFAITEPSVITSIPAFTAVIESIKSRLAEGKLKLQAEYKPTVFPEKGIRQAYIAGPDVFLPAETMEKVFKAKEEICKRSGITSKTPFDGEADPTKFSTQWQAAMAISRANEKLMDASHLVLANMTPYHGPGMDNGTAFEIGYMYATGRPVFGYSNVAESYASRLHDHFNNCSVETPTHLINQHGFRYRDFGIAENRMMIFSIALSGGTFIKRRLPPERTDNIYSDISAFAGLVNAAAKSGTQTSPAIQYKESSLRPGGDF